MEDTNAIIPIWQPQGYSTNHIAKSVGEIYGVKATHTGTLDPMAEGVIIVLTGENRLKRQELSSMVKGYEFEILFGISTDSFDGMGFVTHENFSNTDLKETSIKDVCISFLGSYEQQVPIFSAQLYKGKKLFEWGHQKADIPLPNKKGEIYKFDLISLNKIALKDKISEILDKLGNIHGDFRQEEIISQWENYLSLVQSNTKVFVGKFYVEMSRGLYVRSLSQDLCKKLNTAGFITSLVRLVNGKYTRKECKTLVDLFGGNYANILK